MTAKSFQRQLFAFCVSRLRALRGGKRFTAERCMSDPAVGGVREPLAFDRGQKVQQGGAVARQVGEVPAGLDVPAQDVAGYRVCLWAEEAADVVVDEVQNFIGYATSFVGVLQEQPCL
jgi:hypothetical protein